MAGDQALSAFERLHGVSQQVKRISYPEEIDLLIKELKRMPGVGPRSAERMALWMVQRRDARPRDIAGAMHAVMDRVRPCSLCGFFAVADRCDICRDDTRSRELLCVVEQATDILPLERTGLFKGRYHALGGRISPLDHIGPEDLRIDALLARIREETPSEVVLALSADVEGEATASYLAEVLREVSGVALSRIAQGLPAGSGLETADELTLGRALSGRTRIS